MFKAGDTVRWSPSINTVRSLAEQWKYLYGKDYKVLLVYAQSNCKYVRLEAPMPEGNMSDIVVQTVECTLIHSPAVCECGAKTAGYKPRQPGHSYWCPAE